MQENNQFARFRMLQTEEGEHVICLIYSLVMLTFRTELKGRYSDNTFGHALDSCWRDFVSFVNDFE